VTRTLLGPVTNAAAIDLQAAGSLCAILPAQGWPYMIYRLTIGVADTAATGVLAGTVAKVYVGSNIASNAYRSVSYFGNADDADYPAGLFVPQNTVVVVVWKSTVSPATIAVPANITAAGKGVVSVLAEIEQVTG
jgi:hypothetical protein